METDHQSNGASEQLDPYTLYIKDLSDYPPLSVEVERELYGILECAREAQCILADPSFSPDEAAYLELKEALMEGDKAREMLILSNTRFVIRIAKKWGVDRFMDAIQHGNIGLIYAVDRIDPERDNRLITYAEDWILRYMKRGLLPEKFALKLPERVVESLEKITKFIETNSHLSEPPTIEMIANEVGLSAAKVREYMVVYDLVSSQVDLDGDSTSDDGDPYRVERVPSGDSVEDDALDALLAEEVRTLISTPDLLTPRQKQVMDMVFGLDTGVPMTYDEVGNELHITRQAVSIIVKFAKNRLLPVAKDKYLNEYLE